MLIGSRERPDRPYLSSQAGPLIWFLIDGRRTVAQIAEVISWPFMLGTAQAMIEVREFVSEVNKKGLLEEVKAECIPVIGIAPEAWHDTDPTMPRMARLR
jgi:hypothetical protein